MEFVCFTGWNELPESADVLFKSAEKDSIFFSRPWFENLIQNGLEEDQSVILASVVESDQVLALLPLIKCDGDHWRSLGHLYTSLYTLLLADKNQQEILTCLIQGLGQHQVYSLRLEPVSEDDKNLASLQQAMETCGFTSHRYFRFYNWIHRLHGQSFAAYMAARPARVRNTIARKQRKLEREHGYDIRLFEANELQQGMADYDSVYKASWKVNEVFPNMVEGIAYYLSRTGWLRLAVLYINDQPAAAQFWFVAHGKASIFKLVYDEEWKRYSPGSILISYLMEYVIDTDKVDEIDFLTGNDAYKQDWMSERRERYGVCYVNTSYSRGRETTRMDSLKGWVKRIRTRVYN